MFDGFDVVSSILAELLYNHYMIYHDITYHVLRIVAWFETNFFLAPIFHPISQHIFSPPFSLPVSCPPLRASERAEEELFPPPESGDGTWVNGSGFMLEVTGVFSH